MPPTMHVSWREGVAVEATEAGELWIRGPRSRVAVRNSNPTTLAAFHMMSPPGADEEVLAESVLDATGPSGLAAWYRRLNDLAQRGFLCRAVVADDRRLVTLVPTSAGCSFAPIHPISDRPCRLSRFAYLRRLEARPVLESPRAHCRLVVDDPRVATLIAALCVPVRPSELVDCGGDWPAGTVPLVLSLLASAGFVEVALPDAETAHEPESLQSWEFHDLLFHARIRQGRTDAPCGATYRLLDHIPPPPAIRPSHAGEVIELVRPDLDTLETESLAQVLARRRSIRDYGDVPLTRAQLAEFLFRVARVTDERDVEVETPRGRVRMGFASRPYPAGGALYELELYPAIQSCAGLAPGFYHYEGAGHRLVRIGGATPEFGRLIADAAASAGMPAERVQVLLILASRFPRIAWKYESIAYALTLKHVGVVYQTMYLVATAMNLAPCALGVGDADLFARAAGTDYYNETSVGEFLLGSRSTSERSY